jgi:hypothetical protein
LDFNEVREKSQKKAPDVNKSGKLPPLVRFTLKNMLFIINAGWKMIFTGNLPGITNG